MSYAEGQMDVVFPQQNTETVGPYISLLRNISC